LPRRLASVLVLLFAALSGFAGVARALDFDDEDPEPPHGEVAMVYEYEIGTHAGCLPHRLEIGSGQLPPGLSIRKVARTDGARDAEMFLLEGIPTESGTWRAWIHLRDCDNRSAETLFTFDIWPRSFAITTQGLKPAVVGSPYSAKLEVSGRPSNTTWEIKGGSLPAGLTLSSDGVISGTATSAGSSTFTVQATGNALDFSGTRTHSRELTLEVLGPLAMTVTRTTAEVRVPFRPALAATGGRGPYTWTATGLPDGLVLGADGTFSGSPRRSGSFTFTARVTDATGAVKETQVRVVVRPRLAVATRSLRPAAVGRRYRATLTARGGVEGKRWSVRGSLPRGLRLEPTTGTIMGVPRAAGTARFTVVARDTLGAVSTKKLVLVVR
jgi:hypothetical protein